MGLKSDRFSAKSRIVLNYIAEGHSYEQILRAHPNLTFKDIFLAAQEALEIIEKDDKGTFIPDTHKGFPNHVERIRKSHARAYEPWTKKEEALLTQHVCRWRANPRHLFGIETAAGSDPLSHQKAGAC